MKNKSYLLLAIFVFFLLIFFSHGVNTLFVYNKIFPPSLLNHKVKIEGIIDSLPQDQNEKLQFLFKTKHGIVKLYWSKKFGSLLPNIKPGQRWLLTVKIKEPRGFLNPGLFNYGQWLKRHGIKASGYVVSNYPNQLITNQSFESPIDQIRYNILGKLKENISNIEVLGFVKAILLGDKSGLTKQNKQLFQETGTSHLIAISGLHIGLIFFWFFLVARVLWSLSIRLCEFISAQIFGMWVGWSAALFYSLLAGFAVSTQRAIIMLSVLVVARTLKYNVSARRILSLAALFVLIWQPFSIFDAGFWLSFMAVAFLVYALSARIGKSPYIVNWLYPQFLVLLALMPLTVFWFGAVSTSAFFANLLAIPVVSFLIVPGLFLGVLLIFVNVNLFIFIIPVIKGLFWYLCILQVMLKPISIGHGFSVISLIIAVIGMLLIFTPRGFKLRIAGIVMLFPVLFTENKLADNIDLRAYVLDVGQGLAVVIRLESYTLIYDTGPKFFSGGDAAEFIIVPFLKSIGVSKINTLVVSHSDLDHSGGFKTLVKEFPVNHVYASYDDIKNDIYPQLTTFSWCQEGISFKEGNIKFEFLNPRKFKNNHYSDNDLSCVLKISTPYHDLLLTGDIEKIGEKYLVLYHVGQLASDILIAPHHGSTSSSTKGFIEKVQPGYVVYAAGFQNRFHFPRQAVINRYQQYNAEQYSTSVCGAIKFDINKKIKVETMLMNCQLGNDFLNKE